MILLAIILAPLVGLAFLLTLDSDDARGARRISALSTFVSLALALYCYSQYAGPGSLDHLTFRVGA